MKLFEFLENVKYECIENKLSQSEIETFEKVNNISLPEDYKCFLTNIGNGICISMPDGSDRVVSGIKRKNLEKRNKLLSQPFIFDKPFLQNENQESTDWFEDCVNPEGDDEEICAQCKHFSKCPFAYVDSLDIDELPYYSGTLPICYAGCTYQYFLVLNGKHNGEVWMDNEFKDFVPSKQNFSEFLEWIVTSDYY